MRRVAAVALAVAALGASALANAGVGRTAAAVKVDSPIQHVVFIDEENHSFNDLLGKYCVEQSQGLIRRDGSNDGCIGATEATLHNGNTYQLTREPDFGVNINHGTGSQQLAIDGGAMDGFDQVRQCKPGSKVPHACLVQFDPMDGTCGPSGHSDCLPNLDTYVDHFALSDHTFEFRATPSWAGHMILGDATLEHFTGRNPLGGDSTGSGGPIGWGCDSQKFADWNDQGNVVQIPPCIPDAGGNIAPWYADHGYMGPLADTVPTIFDRMQEAGVSWKIYGGSNPSGDPNRPTNGGYGWTICPDFWSCVGDPAQHANLVKATTIFQDLKAGALPAVSMVTPKGGDSAHPPQSAYLGDAWIGHVVKAVMHSSAWSSTAIFITFDDCGCFYDPVNPLQYNPNWGVRVPMVIVSPYAKAGFTDTTPATFISVTAFIEHTFGLTPLNPCAGETSFLQDCTDDVVDWDGGPTYDYSNAFDFGQAPLGVVPLIRTGLPPAERRWLRAHRTAGTNQAT
jgi:phospholipase C